VKVTGLDHLVVNSRDVERSLVFYCDVLGLEPVRVDEWRRGEVPFPSARVSATTIVDIFPAERTGENVNHFCLVVDDDIDALVTKFPEAARRDGLYGAQGFASSIYVLDPDGNVVELRHYEAP
jgi:catechol 2,3-dioxygenase-like lactoylglutathione lyase family enzyme